MNFTSLAFTGFLFTIQVNAETSFGPQLIIADTLAGGLVLAVDLDADGDQDLVNAAYDRLQWFENDGTGTFSGPYGGLVARPGGWQTRSALR